MFGAAEDEAGKEESASRCAACWAYPPALIGPSESSTSKKIRTLTSLVVAQTGRPLCCRMLQADKAAVPSLAQAMKRCIEEQLDDWIISHVLLSGCTDTYAEWCSVITQRISTSCKPHLQHYNAGVEIRQHRLRLEQELKKGLPLQPQTLALLLQAQNSTAQATLSTRELSHWLLWFEFLNSHFVKAVHKYDSNMLFFLTVTNPRNRKSYILFRLLHYSLNRGLCVVAKRYIPYHANIPGLGLLLVPSMSGHAPSRIGRHDSTIAYDGQHYYLAGPASLLNSSCEDCSNCQLQCTQRRVRSSNEINRDEELVIVYGFECFRPDMACPACHLQLTSTSMISKSEEFPPLPITPEYIRVDEDIQDPDARWCALERERMHKIKRLFRLMDSVEDLFTIPPHARKHHQKKI